MEERGIEKERYGLYHHMDSHRNLKQCRSIEVRCQKTVVASASLLK